jgi:superfamily I DNA and RNA helicase
MLSAGPRSHIAESDAFVIRRGVEQGRLALTACESREGLPDLVAREISKLTEQGLRRNEIAVISLVGRARKDSLARLGKAGSYTLAAADGPDMDAKVVADTMLRFKGLERSAVILTDLSLRGKESIETRRAGMYIAITRARSFLRIIDTRQALSSEAPIAGLPIAG